MRPKYVLLFVILSVCLLPARGQTIVEKESRLNFSGTRAVFDLLIDNRMDAGFTAPLNVLKSKAEFEIVDERDKVISRVEQILDFKSGGSKHRIEMPVGDLAAAARENTPWYRLRYRIGGKAGVVSFSQLLRDIFELRAAAPEHLGPDMNYRIRARAVHAYTRQAVKNVSVKAELKLEIENNSSGDDDEKILKLDGRTDGDGFAVFDFKIPAGIKIGYSSELKITGYKNGIFREIEENVYCYQESASIFLSADKPIYQPGQNFSVRGLYFDALNNVMPGSELDFKIEDEDDTVLYREKVKTSDYGVAAISWRIPENAKLGSYRVIVSGADDLRRDQLTFKVSRYDLPQFSVNAAAVKSFYLPGDNIAEVAVSADYLFGKPVTKGRVRVVREEERRWDYRAQKYVTSEGQADEGDTGADGKFIARVDLSDDFTTLAEDKTRQFSDVNFTAYFTDFSTNRTEERRFDVRISKSPINVYIIRYEENNLHLPITAYFSTFYADGTPAVCDVSVKWKGRELAKFKTGDLGAEKFDFEIPAGSNDKGRYRIEITARDKKGLVSVIEEEFYLTDDAGLNISTDKTIYRPAENIRVDLLSTRKDQLVYVDLLQGRSVIESYSVNVKNNKAVLEIPYSDKLKGRLSVAAYYYDEEDRETVSIARGLIYPERQNLRLSSGSAENIYRPGDDVKINFSVLDSAGKASESALGVVILDKAVEHRARIEKENGTFLSGLDVLLGDDASFGDISLRDINDLDLARPVTEKMQLAAAVILSYSYYRPDIYRSNFDVKGAASFYQKQFTAAFTPVEEALKNRFAADFTYPADQNSLVRILHEGGISFDEMLDPWAQPYYPEFSAQERYKVLTVKSMGPDKTAGTDDDIAVSRSSFLYFQPVGLALDRALLQYTAETTQFTRDAATVTAELKKQGFDLDRLRDSWGRPYRLIFEIQRKNFVIRVHSSGPDGIFNDQRWGDDFDIWTHSVNYFEPVERKIDSILNIEVNGKKLPFPETKEAFAEMLRRNGLDLGNVRDAYGRPVYVTATRESRYADQVTIVGGKQTIKPVTQLVIGFVVKSGGESLGVADDDFTLAEFSNVLTARFAGSNNAAVTIKNLGYNGTAGAFRGVVQDAAGAVIPNANITIVDQNDAARRFAVISNDSGSFALLDVRPGTYSVTIQSPGFKIFTVQNVVIEDRDLVELTITLEAGEVSETVNVTSSGDATLNTTSASVGKVVRETVGQKIALGGRSANSTPRLREYFPETLVWKPELITDKKGKAELNFKMADNITTWKMYAVASNKKGRIGVTEKELTSFQPFFVDLDPPKFLTVGDEISLPVQIRNYTDKKQRVDISLAKSGWFSFLGADKQQVDVAAGDSRNAVFGFKTLNQVRDGKQRVTALAQKESDAVEKPLTVRPDGREMVKTSTLFTQGAGALDVNFPAHAMPGTQAAELKIYPNLMAHVAESIEGLLQRPYGCGEQTISSTYPNLMILKFSRGEDKLHQTARKYLNKGYERLLGYQKADGGFSYWGGDSPSDLSLTAYAIRFLNDAKGRIDVDNEVIERAQKWLIEQQKADGSWVPPYYHDHPFSQSAAKLTTSYVARTLSMGKDKELPALQKALAYLKTRNAEIDEPYALALYGLTLFGAGADTEAGEIAARLEKMAINEGSGSYWKLETNTPFHGWGTAGRVETTALVLQLLAKTQNTGDAYARGMSFLLKNKDRYGVWYSTQTTINVLDTFLTGFAPSAAAPEPLKVFLNGELLREVAFPADRLEPLILELNEKLRAADNRIELRGAGASLVMAQVVSTHYIDWKDSAASGVQNGPARALEMSYGCDKQTAAVMQEINCTVRAERVGFKGYGMLLAEIGTPPGAEVSRESLERALGRSDGISKYEVLPDRIVVYMWAVAGGTKFDFSFKPRYGINAQTPASVVYDYYNPEAQAVVTPLRFSVK